LNQKYRGATKERRRGENTSTVRESKQGGSVKTNYLAAGAETGHLGKIKTIVVDLKKCLGEA